VRSVSLAERSDNPRTVNAELRIRRGQILDANDVLLAETTGPITDLARVYPLTEIGPAVGYYSLRYGTAGVENSLDDVLRGETSNWRVLFGRTVLHEPQVGRDVRLTLDAAWQVEATRALGGRPGAVLVLSLPDGAIRVLASSPGYDPNRLDESFDALADAESGPLVNRVTQGHYQPGMSLQPMILAGLLDAGAVNLGMPATEARATVMIDGTVMTCLGPVPESPTLGEALAATCPAPLLDLAGRLPEGQWLGLFDAFGLTEAPSLPLVLDVPTPLPVESRELALLGQDTLTVTPLQLAVAWLALVNDGSLVQPRLVAAVEAESGAWDTVAPVRGARQVVAPESARAILSALAGEQDMIEHVSLAIAGPDGSAHTWYLGAAPAAAPQFVVVAIAEDSRDLTLVRELGRRVAAYALGLR
jgi:peptidoglycan glycosyltransferase